LGNAYAPAKGMTYNDPTFGCPVTRITDASQDDLQGSVYEALDMGYASISPFNANDTYLMLSDVLQNYFVTDLQGNVVISMANFPPHNSATWSCGTE
jgi:hypothetical protein